MVALEGLRCHLSLMFKELFRDCRFSKEKIVNVVDYTFPNIHGETYLYRVLDYWGIIVAILKTPQHNLSLVSDHTRDPIAKFPLRHYSSWHLISPKSLDPSSSGQV